MVITPACHAGGRGFESRPPRNDSEYLGTSFRDLAQWLAQSVTSGGRGREDLPEACRERLGFADVPERGRIVGVPGTTLDDLRRVAADRHPRDPGRA